ncbi:MAG TPA: agmatine deiminase family protein, partial [Candidatus Acidoferrum sp.]|nr:agmatine deiminase family protein [Candidatus Acidoferrum sp.]
MPKEKTTTEPAPAQAAYSMPAEWEPHEATWLGWPHNADDWPGKFETIPWVYGEMVRKIARGEKIYLLVRNKTDENLARRIIKSVGADVRKIKFVAHPTNRGWTRDAGPIFVKRATETDKSDTAIVHFHFNGWAKYDNWRKDTKVPETAARVLNKKLFHAQHSGKPFVIEGGGIELNGKGTLISTEQCYLDPKIQVRNPDLGKGEIEATLRNYL